MVWALACLVLHRPQALEQSLRSHFAFLPRCCDIHGRQQRTYLRYTASMNDKGRCGKDYHIAENPRNPRYVVKQAINSWLARLAHFSLAGCSLGRAPWALLLETSRLHTMNALCAADTGIIPSTTVVPNPDAKHCEEMVAAGVHAFKQTSHALLASLCQQNKDAVHSLSNTAWPGVFDVVWLDYCGTFASIPGRHRRNDISSLLRKDLLAACKNGKDQNCRTLLAVTFSQRGVAPLYPHEVSIF